MNYIALFNLLYSTEISEATKDEIVNKINTNISESYEVKPIVGTYMELLDTLVFSTASESLIYNIIDEAFSQLSEETINEVSNEWVKKKVGDSLKARQSAVDSANKSVKSGVVGLSQLRRQDQAQSNLERGQKQAASIQAKLDKKGQATPSAEPKAETPKAQGAMGKLKSAVGKVKSFVSKADKGPNYVGLSRAIGAKANKDNIGAETLRQQTTHKTETPAEEKQPEVKAPKAERVKQPKMKKEKQPEPVQQKLDLKAPKTEEKQPEVKAEVKADDATKAAKKTSTRATKISKAKKIVADAVTNKATSKEKTPKTEEKQPEVKAEVKADDATKAANDTKTSKKRTGSIKINAGSKIKKAEGAPAEEKQSEDNIPNKDNPELHALHKELADNSKKAQEGDKEAKKKFRNARKKIAEIEANLKSGEKYTDVYGNEREAGKSLSPENSKGTAEKATPKAENKPAEEPKIKVSTEKSDEDKKYEAKLRREAAARRKDQEKQLGVLRQRKQEMTSKPGYDTKAVEDLDSRISDLEKRLNVTANEALSDLAILLLNTNITESCFVEVMEMAGANKANALKVRDRYDNDMEASLDAIDKDVREGKPVDPEKVKKAEELRQRKEHFEQMFKDKFNDNK